MSIDEHARNHPERTAYRMAVTGESMTYGDLNERSVRFSRLLDGLGLAPGDHFAFLLENGLRFPEVCWGALRTGLYYTAISTRFTPEEVAHVLADCGARVFVTSTAMEHVAAPLLELMPATVEARFATGGPLDGYEDYEAAVADAPAQPLEREVEGQAMLYSGGTTGRPKGVKPALLERPLGQPMVPVEMYSALFQIPETARLLLPAPLYHNAPLQFLMYTARRGETTVIMERFGPEKALAAIEKHRINYAQFVPAMFVQMLKLPEEVRGRYDVSSMEVAVHGAAPCPIEIKERMIEWWGPVLLEYYGSTEPVGAAIIDSREWLEHKGSVGRSMLGPAHILDDDGVELPPGEPGLIYFEPPPFLAFQYHNDPEMTAAATSEQGWITVGDIGHLDENGYLYLTDRASFMIISGGVNIYPQEAENVLVNHPAVYDCGVIGTPHEEMGEEVKAIVVPMEGAEPGPALEAELIAYCQDRLAKYKCPRSVDFVDELPRSETGKLFKRELRARYWADYETEIR